MPVSFKLIEKSEELMVNREGAEYIINDIFEMPELVKELKDEGFGKEIHGILLKNDYVACNYLLRWIENSVESFKIIKELVDEFAHVELMEHLDTRFMFRVPKGDKTIGFFFGYLENLKQIYNIDDYSASQTTLEQIFNGFARMENENATDHRIFDRDSN